MCNKGIYEIHEKFWGIREIPEWSSEFANSLKYLQYVYNGWLALTWKASNDNTTRDNVTLAGSKRFYKIQTIK